MWLDKLKEMKSERGLTTKEIAEKSGIPEPTLEKLFSGATKDPKLATMQQLVHFLGFTLDDLSDEQKSNEAFSKDEQTHIKKYRSLDPYGKEAVDSILDIECRRCKGSKVGLGEDTEPQVEYIRHYLTSAAAGYAAPIEGEDYELVVRGADVPAKADFSLDISGDSMMPYIKNGQTVYVQRAAELHEFEVGIFFVDGDVFCKQWCPGYAGETYLLSANPKRQDANITISRDSGRNCVYFGKVLLDKKLPRPVYL